MCEQRLVMMLPAWLASTKAEIVADREIITDCHPRGWGMSGGISLLNFLPL
jgi:hypothetical protein